MGNTLFGRLLGAVAAEVIKEMGKSAEQRFHEAEERDRKKARKRERRAESMANLAEGFRRNAERQYREAQRKRHEEELEGAATDGAYPFEMLRDRYVTSAIALVRPYPPHRSKAGRSHVGGLPDLPAGVQWPRNREGDPLHFLAQVDLAELPAGSDRPAELPLGGTLLFFAPMEGTLAFDDGNPVRVVYDSDSSGVRAQAPDDLAPVDRAWERSFADEVEPTPSIFPEWPWALAGIRSIPDTTAFGINSRGEERYSEYDEQLRRFRSAEIQRTTGLATAEDNHWPDLGIYVENKQYRGPYQLLPFERSGFPWTSRGVVLVCRAILSRFARSDLDVRPLSEWLSRAEAEPNSQRVSAEEANAFIANLNQMMGADQRPHVRNDGTEALIPQDRIKRVIEVAAHRLITETGADPQLAAALPDSLYRNAYPRHAPITGRRIQHGQLLGFVPSSQEPLQIDSPLLTLLQLPTDTGIDLIIGDMGEIDVHIERDALAARRWDQIRAWHMGG